MESLKELDDFLFKRGGTSYGELRNVFSDEVSLKKFIKLGLETGRIVKDGEKRGTKYFSAKNADVSPKQNNQEKDTEKTYETGETVDTYLNSDRPLPCTATLIVTKTFGPGGTLNVHKFLESGQIIETTEVAWNKLEKKNVIVNREEFRRFNTLSFKKTDREYILYKYDNFSGTIKKECYPEYEEFREAVRSFIKV